MPQVEIFKLMPWWKRKTPEDVKELDFKNREETKLNTTPETSDYQRFDLSGNEICFSIGYSI